MVVQWGGPSASGQEKAAADSEFVGAESVAAGVADVVAGVDETVVPDNPSTRGMIHKVRHLVSVTPEEG